jgi:peptide/nickel transport system substrate-binding protein
VAFSIGLLQQAHPRGRSTFAPVADIETQDPHTAVLVLADAHFA